MLCGMCELREKWIRDSVVYRYDVLCIAPSFASLPPLTLSSFAGAVSPLFPKHAKKTHHITNFPSFHVRAHTHATPTCYHPFSLSPCILYLLYIYETTKPHTNTTKSMSTTTRIIWNKLNQLKNGTQINTFIYYELSELPKWK